MDKNLELITNLEQSIKEKNIENIEKLSLTLIKNYKKLSKRFDRIISQSDMQQREVLKLSETLEQRNLKIKTLLDNAAQGFLQFNDKMQISSEFSKKANEIFQVDLTNKDITKLLYPNNPQKADFLKETLVDLLEEDSFRQEIIISLLDTEFIINNQNIKVEYKVLQNNNFMLILTDITQNKILEKKAKEEQRILKMVVETVTSKEQFLEVLQMYKDFIKQIENYKNIEKLNQLRMQIHTFKGLFAQKEMLNITQYLHTFESKIDESLNKKILLQDIQNINENIMFSWIKKDLDILKDILGEEFFSHLDFVTIEKSRLEEIYNKAKKYPELAKEIKTLQYFNIKPYVKPYKKLIEQLSKRFDKPINFIFECDSIYLPDKFKPFLNSLVHVFRNAIDHGIELPEIRYMLNKNETATIKFIIKKIDDDMIISIEDDGLGIDETKVKNIDLIFEEGFSTKNEISTISGRGIGLSSVKKEIQLLNGTINVINKPKKGVKFIFKLPLNDYLHENLLKKLTDNITQMLNIPSNYNIQESNLELLDYNSVIDLINLNDKILISVDDKTVNKIIKYFTLHPKDVYKIPNLKQEAINEFLNIALGNTLSKISQKIEISTPYKWNNQNIQNIYQIKLKNIFLYYIKG